MIFSSTTFLFIFLPITLTLHLLSRLYRRAIFLLIVSLVFYAWNEPKFILLLLFLTVLNFVSAYLMNQKSLFVKKSAFFSILSVNLIVLAYYKYYSAAEDSSAFFLTKAMPLGLSFIILQLLSYQFDAYRELKTKKIKFTDLFLYITFFPYRTAGPIVRCGEFAQQLTPRKIDLEEVFEGIKRFIRGLSKKILIADILANIADGIFQNPNELNSMGLAWLGIICYTLQLYFDFDGYSDMAIGLAKIFGIALPENFNKPYMSKSVREFWRRWHITFSNWLKDYVYIPLGGSKKGTVRTYVNLLVVFAISGVWHGVGWNFIVWGIWNGFFVLIERTAIGKYIESAWLPFRHIYTLLVVMVGWVFFRAKTIPSALVYLQNLLGFRGLNPNPYLLLAYVNNLEAIALLVGIILSLSMLNTIRAQLKLAGPNKTAISSIIHVAFLTLCVASIAGGTFKEFLYGNF